MYYELTGESIVVDDETLYRIRATRDLPYVNKDYVEEFKKRFAPSHLFSAKNAIPSAHVKRAL